MTIETVPFDASEFFQAHEDQVELLKEAIESGEAGFIAAALGTIAKARGMSSVAREAGVTRETLYHSLRDEGDPRLSTVLGVARALGLVLTIEPAKAA